MNNLKECLTATLHVAEELGPCLRDEFRRVATAGSATANDEPGVERSLSTGDATASERGRVSKASHQQGHHDIALLVRQLAAHGQHQEHVVAVGHAVRIQAAQNAGASDLALPKRKKGLPVRSRIRCQGGEAFETAPSRRGLQPAGTGSQPSAPGTGRRASVQSRCSRDPNLRRYRQK